MRLLKDNTVAVCIDIQEKLFPFINDNSQLTDNCIKIISGLKIIGVPVIVTEQYSKGLGTTIEPLKAALEEEYQPLEKMTFSCMKDDEFLKKIKRMDKKNVIVFGIEAHVCVLQTALDLREKGFIPILIEDCTSSRKLNDKSIAIERMRSEGVIISTLESILFEMLVVSGTDEFRAVSKIIK
ncbi:MAG: hypothetical protein HW421_4121 [Ignavibacteria bacterium]|nr:hypothetical protein [Ignavibacteria bacterium]